MPLKKPGRHQGKTPSNNIMETIILKLARWAQKWSHSKLGWLSNKIAIGLGGLFTSAGIEAGDTAQTIAGAVITIIAVLLELGVKVASEKFVRRFQIDQDLTRDGWPGPKARARLQQLSSSNRP